MDFPRGRIQAAFSLCALACALTMSCSEQAVQTAPELDQTVASESAVGTGSARADGAAPQRKALDLGAVVERARHFVVDAGADPLWGSTAPTGTWATAGRTYATRFDTQGTVTFQPRADGAAGGPVSWRTRGVSVGGRALLHPTVRARNENRVTYAVGPVVEMWESRDGQVEQTWTLSRSAGQGGLVITGDLSAAPEQTGTGLHFASRTGPGVHVSDILVTDAASRTLRLRHQLEGAVARIEVPGDWLAGASYPVVIDPVWQGELGTDNPIYENSGAAKTSVGPVAVSDYAGGVDAPTQILIAWIEDRAVPYKAGNGVYGVVVNEAGAIQSGGPLAISTGEYSYTRPALAHLGSRWLVAWTDDRGAGRYVRAAVLDQGNPRNKVELVVEDGASGLGNVAAGSDGTRFHVAFSADGNGKDIFLASVDGAATVVAGPTNVTNAGGDQRTPDVAGSTGRALLAWRNDSAANIQGKGVVGTSLVGATRTLASADDPKRPAVACYNDTGATRCRAAWHTEGGANEDVKAGSVNVADTGLDTPSAEENIDVTAGDQRAADILATPVGVTIAYQSTPPAQDSDIVAKGFLLNWTAVFTLTVAGEDADEIGPAVVRIDDTVGYTWNDNNGNILYGNADALGQNETTPVVVNRSANVQHSPSVAFSGLYYLVSWVDERTGADVYATRVDNAGNVLDPAGITVETGGAASGLTSCTDGSRFLVVWIEGGTSVRAARVVNGGGVLGVDEVRSSQTDVTIDQVRCSFATNDKFLVVWAQEELGTRSLHARNLRNTDATLGDLKELVTSDLGAWGLTSAGANNFHVWEDTSDSSITVRRTDKNGTLKMEMATLGTASGSVASIDATVGGGVLVAVWSDVDGDGDVSAVRINTTLGAGLKTPIVLESGADDARQVSVSALRGDYFSVSWVVYDGNERNIQGAELTKDDAQLPNGFVIANVNPFDIAVSAHRESGLDSAGDGAGEALFVWDRFVPEDRNARRIVTNLAQFNRAPTGDIAADAASDEGDEVTFDGSGSVDLDGDTLTYEWDFDYDGNAFDVEDTGDAVAHIFTDDFTGDVALRVTDPAGESHIVTHSMVVSNVAPSANAGGNQSVQEGTQVNFTGSATDPGAGDVLLYEWDFNYDGNNFNAQATGTNVSYTYTDDSDCNGGTCVVALRVSDDDGGADLDTLDVDVSNATPVANAGADQTVNEGATVTFSGTGQDAGADTLTLEWDLDNDGSFDDGVGQNATFVYPDDGNVTARLRVTDDDGDSHIDSLVVTVQNVAPTANAGADQTVGEGTEITLDGSGSTDPGTEDTLTYDWDLDGDGQYDDASGVTITHTYNDEVTVNVGLRVSDGDGGVGTDTVQITVQNVAPTAAAGDDIAAQEGVEVDFAGSAEDPGDDTLTYAWDLDGDGQFDDAVGPDATFTYPDDATVTVRLRVTDEDGASGTDSLTVTVANVAPANVSAGGNRSADEGDELTFTGVATDVAADVLTYQWDFDDDGTFDDSGATVTYAYPDDDSFTLRLRVTDDDGGQTDDTITVNIANVAPSGTNIAAVAQANEGSAVSFVGTTNDPGTADTITYAWDFGDGDTDAGANVAHAYGDQGSFTVTLDVDDGDGGTDSDTHNIEILNVAPTVVMVEFVGAAQGVETQFEAAVSDPGDDTLFYTWDVICNDLDQNDCNNSDEYTFGDVRVGQDLDTVPITFNVIGSYTVTLSVDDQDGGVTEDSTEVEVANAPPVVTLEGDPTTIDEGDTVNFTGTANDPGGDDLTYAWNFGDGTTAVDNLARVHTYTGDGVFTAVLRATDTNGESGQASVVITVNNVAPVATVGNRTLEENVSTAFTVSITDPGADTHSCVWDFGDSTDPVVDADCSGVAHTYTNDDTYTLTVTVDDGVDTGVGTATITVQNVPPTVLFANHSGEEGTAVTFTASAEDRSPDDQLTYTWNFGDGTAEVTTAQPTVSHTYVNNDVYSVTLTVDDGTDEVEVIRTATIDNVPPTVFAGDDQTVSEGAEVSFSGTASDPGDDTLVYAWDLDGDNQFDDGDTPEVTYTYDDDATVTVRLRVFDGDDTVTDTLQVTVQNVAPTADAGDNQSVNEGDTVTFAGAATDPGNDTLTYNWDYGDGDSGDDVGPTPTHTYAQEGVFTAELTVEDDDGGEGSNTVQIRVANVAPTVDLTAVDGDVNEGTEVNLTATVTDPGADTLTYTWDFGDGDTDEGEDLDAVAHTWTQEGSYTVRLTVNDGTASTTDTISVNVVNVAPTVDAGDDQTIDEGDSVTFEPSIADPGDDNLTYSWTFGDGGSSSDRAPTHRFRQQGIFTVTLTVNDQTNSVSDTLTITANNVAPTVNAGNDATRAEGQEHVFSATASDPGPDDILTYHWDFGDGTTVSGRNLNAPRHTYADDRPGDEEDQYTVTLRVEDRDGGSTTDTVVIRVNNVAPTVEAGIDRAGNEGSLVVFDGAAADPGADPLTFTWDFGDGASASGIALSQPTHIYAQDGNYTVTLTVDDGDGGVVADTLTVRVTNVAPVVVAVEPSYSGQEGSPVTMAVRTFDPGDDTLHVVWNYRDTTQDEGDELNEVTHTWADDGIFDVIVTVTDGDGGRAVTTVRVTVSNIAPSIQSLPPLFGSQDVLYVYEPRAVDPGADTLSWDLQDNPTGMVVDRLTGRLEWTPNLGHVNNQPEAGWRVLLRVRDDGLAADSQEFFIDLAFTDDDNDGIADSCEARCPGDFEVGVQEDPNGDFDNDGIDNRTECGQGTSICVTNAPGAPTPVAPADGFLQEVVPVALVVQNAIDPDDDILTYTFEVFDAEDTENPVFTSGQVASGNGQTTLPVRDNDVTFAEDADYLWRCRAADANAAGPWSDLFRFRISLENNVPSVPMPLSPIGSAGELMPLLTARNAIDPEGETLEYDFQVFIVEDELPELIMESYGNPEGDERSQWQVAMELSENQSYQWRVRATDARSASSRWSEMVTFLVNTQNSLPEAPVLVYPGDDAAVGAQPAVLVASAAFDADGDILEYEFKVAGDAEFNDLIETSPRLNQDARREIVYEVVADLSEDQAYYWQVQAFDETGGGAVASRKFRFTSANLAPPAVTVQAPAQGESVPVADPDFVWLNVVEPDGDAVTYDVDIFGDEAMSQLLYNAREVPAAPGATSSWAGPSLADDAPYWWRARAVDATGQEGAWSELTRFFVNVRNDPPEAPELDAPGVGDALAPDAPAAFSWFQAFDPDGDALTYTIEVFAVAADGERVLRETGIAEAEGESTSWTASENLPPGAYNWHVRASDAELDGPWSREGVFAVADVVPDDTSDVGPDGGDEPDQTASYPEKTAACGCETPASPPRHGHWLWVAGLALLGAGLRGWHAR